MQNLNWTMILGLLFTMSEGIAMLPGVKANSVFQALMSIMGFLKAKTFPTEQK